MWVELVAERFCFRSFGKGRLAQTISEKKRKEGEREKMEACLFADQIELIYFHIRVLINNFGLIQGHERIFFFFFRLR